MRNLQLFAFVFSLVVTVWALVSFVKTGERLHLFIISAIVSIGSSREV